MKKILTLFGILIFVFALFPTNTVLADPTGWQTSLAYNADKSEIHGTIAGESGTITLYKRNVSKYLGYSNGYNTERSRGYYYVFRPSERTMSEGSLEQFYSYTAGSGDDTRQWGRGVNISMANVDDGAISPPSSPDDPTKTTPSDPSGEDPGGSDTPTEDPDRKLSLTPTAHPETDLFLGDFESALFGGSCSSYECWIQKVWAWAMVIMIPLSVIVLSVAGILYMTSEGDSERVKLAKRLIIGVVSGIAIIVLARIFLVTFTGLSGEYYDDHSSYIKYNIKDIWNLYV